MSPVDKNRAGGQSNRDDDDDEPELKFYQVRSRRETAVQKDDAKVDPPLIGEATPEEQARPEDSEPVDIDREMQAFGFHREVAESGESGSESPSSPSSGHTRRPAAMTPQAVRVAHQYWVIEQARVVTHGIFSDYVPSDVTGREKELINNPKADAPGRPVPTESFAPPVGSTSCHRLNALGPEPGGVSDKVADAEEIDERKNFEPDPGFGWVPTGTQSEPQSAGQETEEASAAAVKPVREVIGPPSPPKEIVLAASADEDAPARPPAAPQTAPPRLAPKLADSHDRQPLNQHLRTAIMIVLSGIVFGAAVFYFLNSSIAPQPSSRNALKEEKPAGAAVENETPAPVKQTEEVNSRLKEFQLGLKYEKEKDYEAALSQFNIVLSGSKPTAEAYHSRGRVLTKLEKFALAKDDLERASIMAPRDRSILMDLAAVKFLLNDYAGAVLQYDRLIDLEHNSIDAFYGRGISYAALGKHDDAISDLQQVVRLKPTYGDAYRQLVSIYLAMGQNDKAEGVATLGIKYNASAEDLYFCRALAIYKLGRKELALADYDRAIALNAGRKEFYNDRGYVLMELGRIEMAKHDFEKALQIDPDYSLAQENLKNANLQLERRKPPSPEP